jgi:diguanylate cyclase (GGDEF)-like protein
LTGAKYSNLRRTLLAFTKLPTLLAAAVIGVLGVYADHQNSVVFQQRLRAETLAQVNLVRAKLEGNLNSNLQLVRGLVSTITTEPWMTQTRFSALAQNLFREQTQLRSIAAAPSLVITMIYPVEGNERALGLDYRLNDAQRDAAFRARDTGELVLAGPVELKQGGEGFIGRFPVFIGEGTARQFWGVVSAVIDSGTLYRDSGLLDAEGVEIALVGVDGQGQAGKHFYGDPRVFDANPVTAVVALPAGTWQIAATPSGGWQRVPDNAWLLRSLILIAGILVVVPVAFAGRFYGDRRESHAALRRSEAEQRLLAKRLELALEVSRVGVWEIDLETRQIYWDERLHEIYGIVPDGQMRTQEEWASRLHPDDQAQAVADFAAAVKAKDVYDSQFRIVRDDGEIRDIRSRAMFYRESDDTPKMIGAEWDVTEDVRLSRDLARAKTLAETRNRELEAAKSRIEFNALHDSLTGLPNRRYLDEMLGHFAAACTASGRMIGLLHIDLDRFKQINDTLGHAAGDAMLVHASRVLKANVSGSDFVARIGGDEFVVACATETGAPRLAEIALCILEQMREPITIDGHACRTGVSIGIASEGGARVDTARLLVNADIALYRAKRRGRNCFEFFTSELQAEIVRTKRIADDILGGLERGEFLPHYQPQFDARTLEIAGVEALARWQHPRDGLLTPFHFLKTAEELNVVASIDRIILEKSLADFSAWNRAGATVPRLSVNVSARRLRDEELATSLRKLKFAPGTLSFELVESIFLDESDDVIVGNVERIKKLGIDVEIDDFGTGYASIVSLLKLQPRRLKIDRQLVMPIVNSVRQRQLVESMIDIGRTLGIEVLAEGVETMEHARILQDIGCDYLQGYALGRPMSGTELAATLRKKVMRAAC